MREVRITGLAAHLPRGSVKNSDLKLDPPLTAAQLDRFGIHARTRADDDETVTSMAEEASRRALLKADVSPATLDFVLLASWSERRYVPDLAPAIAHRLGARNSYALDLCGACCGFIFGLATAASYLQNPRYRRGLVVASDRSSRRMRPGTRSTIVFGDGAAAAVVEAETSSGFRLIDYELRSDGAHHGIMDVDGDGYLNPHIRQADLNPLAGRTMAEATRALLERNALTLDDIDRIVPHSGTAGVQKQLQEALGVSNDKVLTNLPLVGNLTTASIPCALSHFIDTGELHQGDRVLTVAVGLGWHSVSLLLEL